MNRKGSSTVEAGETIKQKDEFYTSHLFASDLDGAAYKHFDQYRRWFAEANTQRAETIGASGKQTKSLRSSKQKDFVRFIQGVLEKFPEMLSRSPELGDPAIVLRFPQRIITDLKRDMRKAARRQAKVVVALLREFDACNFQGARDFIYRRSFKDNLREVLLEYLSDPNGSVHIHECGIMVPAEYQLSGQSIGGFFCLKPPYNIPQLVIEALFWKSRRTLGLLWALAEHGESGALLRLARTVVPFVKAINEKIGADASVLDGWPKGLPYWPVLKSPHHDFDGDHRALLKTLQVGKNYPFTIAEETRWTVRNAVGKWAIHLCQEIEIMRVSDYSPKEDSEPWEYQLVELQPFSSETWKDWWKVAKGLLRHEYVDVVKILELNKIVKSDADRKSPGRIRKRIFQALEDKFKSMAKENKVKNVSRKQPAQP